MESHTTASTLPRSQSSPNGVPSTSTFSFKAPFPVSSPVSAAAVSALKQRRVSLASPSSPRLVKPFSFRDEMGLQTSDTVTSTSASTSLPEKKGKMRKIDPATKSDDSLPLAMPVAEKKPRKKWSSEETQMLVEGCRIHGVGNWKTILQDPDLKFHDRSAVDLKDRFRTYFPDAYKKHYPNAKTHLSSKIRSTFADGTSLFEKTRSKRRRPFTDAEDRALKAGYEKHGTTWAAIVKDPIFQEQNRRSTDLRDRFRNAFPLLYQAAGYKPRTTSKKKVDTPVRAADDQLATTTGPIRSRRKAQASQGLRGGTKSVPQSTACSEDEESSAGEEDNETYIFKKPPTPIFIDSNPNFRVLKRPLATQSTPATIPTLSATSASVTNNGDEITETNDDMDLAADADPLNIPDFLPNSTHSDLETWSSSGLNTPTHSSTAAWSTAAASPTSSHVSDFFMSAASGASNDASNSSSPFIQRRNDILGNNFGMIGKSAWGTQDWFSPNPKLESSRSSTSSSSFIDSSFSPASPFTYHPHLNHGVLDRYDLFPPSMPDGNSSEAGYGDTHATFFDDIGGVPGSNAASSGGTGFKGYHSPFAGDLISGTTTSRMHTSTSFSSSAMSLASLPSIYGSSFSSGFGNGSSSVGMGLGLENIPEDGSIHPMQLHSHSHTPSLLSIDELGLTGISLNDHDSSSTTGTSGAGDNGRDATMDDSPLQGRQDLMSLAFAMPHSSSPEKHKQEDSDLEDMNNSLHSDSFGLDDLVDMNELHATPPATPVLTQPRPLRRSSGGAMLHSFDHSSMGGGSGNSHHARSISVPPSEARNSSGPTLGGMTMSMDDVGLHMHQAYSGMHEMNLSSLTGAGRNLQAIFNPNFSSPSTSPSLNLNVNVHSHNQQQTPEHIRMSDSSGSLHSPMSTMSPILRHQQHQQSQHHQQTLQQPRTIFPGNLMLSPSSPQALSSPNSSDPRTLNHHLQMNDNHNINSSDPWRNTVIPGVDYSYNLPFLDLHYYMLQGNQHGISVDGTLDDHSEARQGQALDLAQSAALTSSASSLSSALSFKGLFEPTPSPVGTIRQHASSKSTGLPPSFMSSLSINPAALTGNGSTDPVSQHDTAKSRMQNDTRTIRQSQIKSSASGSGGATVNRSMSHHRGQSAVCPQDLMLRNDNKRKRASWDGGLA